jgi:hypothetical protein
VRLLQAPQGHRTPFDSNGFARTRDHSSSTDSACEKTPCYTGSMTTNNSTALADLSDREILAQTHDAVRCERVATAKLIALLMELDARRLYLGEGCSSLFTYCTQVLHLSEHAAYNRIESARAARRFPVILELVESAAVTLTTVRLLSPHLTEANYRDVLERARHKSKREIEVLVATLSPRPDAPSMVRKLPAPAPSKAQVAASQELAKPDTTQVATTASVLPSSRPAEVKPLAPERYKIQFTVSRETYEKLLKVQDLLRHSVPTGDPAIIFERGLDLLLTELERAKFAASTRPRASRAAVPASRYIPAEVRRAVWQRDGGRCAFNGSKGQCTETGFLEYHHVVPFAEGGETSARNLELRCRAHNQYEADLWFGVSHTARVREERAYFGV